MPQGWTPVAEPAAASGWTPVPEVKPDFTATNEPPSTSLKAAAYGKDALQLALDALPGAGAVVGGALATPETLGGGTLAGAALGAGAGRGLRDLIAAGLGLQKPTTAMGEGKTIAMDAGETYLAGKILPALWAAIKAPGATVADVYEGVRGVNDVLPHTIRFNLPKLPAGVGKAPAAILERPAWQTWQAHLPDAQPSPQVARSTGTSMIPAAVPAPMPATSQPPMATPAPAPSTAAPPMATPAPAPATEFQAAKSARANALPDQKALNEARLAEIRAAYQAKQGGAAAAPTVVPASGKMRLTLPEWIEFQRLVKSGMSLDRAEAGAKAAGAFARQAGLSQPTLEQTRFPKAK